MACCGRSSGPSRAQPAPSAYNGKRVTVTSGQYKGRSGTVVGMPRTGQFSVLLDGEARQRVFYASFLRFV